MYSIAENVHRWKKFAKPRYLCIAETIPSGNGRQIIYVIINTEALKHIHKHFMMYQTIEFVDPLPHSHTKLVHANIGACFKPKFSETMHAKLIIIVTLRGITHTVSYILCSWVHRWCALCQSTLMIQKLSTQDALIQRINGKQRINVPLSLIFKCCVES